MLIPPIMIAIVVSAINKRTKKLRWLSSTYTSRCILSPDYFTTLFFLFLFLIITFSARVAEEKIRYAAYNCLAIDTDVSPWEE